MDFDPGEIVLDAVEARVVGALVEKAVTTPDYYPLSLNALVNACNQTSNRDPVTTYDEAAVTRALESLRAKKMVFVFEGAANRVAKYGHKFAEALGLGAPEMAVLCVLLLRGPQTLGEIRGRTSRLHQFATLGDVETTLQALAGRAPRPLVLPLPRQTGFKEPRYAHLLSGTPAAAAAAAANAVVVPAEPATAAAAESAGATNDDRLDRLEQEVASLRREVDELKARMGEVRGQPSEDRRQ